MKKTLRFFALMMIGLLPLIMWSCSDDDDSEAPSGKNPIIGTWFLDDDMEPELYTFKKDGSFISALWKINNPEVIYYEYGSYRYDEENGVLQLAWDEHDMDIYYNVTIVGNSMTWEYGESGGRCTLHRRS